MVHNCVVEISYTDFAVVGGGVAGLRAAIALAEGGQTLVDSGRLRDSITHAVEPGRAVIGSNLVYAAIHQLGGEAGRNRSVTLPARPYLGISPADEIEIGAILDDHLSGAVQ